MTKANSLDPPRLATWLLEQFAPVPQNVWLAGDLMEAFRQGRSSGWYWRQVFWAIFVVFLQSLRKHWGRLAHAVVCGGLISSTWFFMFPVTTRIFVRSTTFVEGGAARVYWDRTVQEASALPAVFALYAKSYGIQWPWSLVYQVAFLTVFEAVIVALALGAYFGFARILQTRNFLRVLMVAVAVLASSNMAATFLSVPFGDIQSAVHPPRFAGWVLIATPATLALLIGVWRVHRGGSARPISA